MLSLHMDGDGASCFPSISLLARETHLSTRAIKQHLTMAAAEGWLTRQPRPSRRNEYSSYLYHATIPTPEPDGVLVNVMHQHQPQQDAALVNLSPSLVQLSPTLVHHVHSRQIETGETESLRGEEFKKSVSLLTSGDVGELTAPIVPRPSTAPATPEDFSLPDGESEAAV
jgi:DNA-binding transcriptional MocR family regulator